jgi:hypothetical protein
VVLRRCFGLRALPGAGREHSPSHRLGGGWAGQAASVRSLQARLNPRLNPFQPAMGLEIASYTVPLKRVITFFLIG